MLPLGEGMAKRVILESERHEVIQGVLHFEHVALPGGLCVVVCKGLPPALLPKVHAGCFARHFAVKKVCDCLHQYWWKGMWADIQHFCRECLVCASHKGLLEAHSTGWCGCVAAVADHE